MKKLWQPYFDAYALPVTLPTITQRIIPWILQAILPSTLPSILNEYLLPPWNLDCEWIFGHTLKPWCSNECFLCIFNGMYVKAMPGLVKCFWCNLGYKVAQNIHAICLSHSNLHNTSTCWAVSSLLYKWKHENVNLAFLYLILLLVLFLLLSPCSRPPFGWHKPEILFGTRLYSNYFWKEDQQQKAFGCLSLMTI